MNELQKSQYDLLLADKALSDSRRLLNKALLEEPEKVEQYSKEHEVSEAAYASALGASMAAYTDTEAQWKKELKGLVEGISAAKYFISAVDNKPLDGKEAELNQELGLSTRKIPFEALLSDVEDEEEYADVVTQVADIDDGSEKHTRPVVERVFARNAVGWLGVAMPMVPAGQAEFPYVTDGTTAGFVAEGSGTDAGDLEMAVETVLPTTLDASYIVSREALTRFGAGKLNQILRRDLRRVMGNALDNAVINGNGTAPNPTGILQRMTTVSYPNGATGATADDSAHTWEDVRRTAWEFLDDQYIISENAGRLLVGTETYKWMRGLDSGHAAAILDAVQGLTSAGVSVRYSSRLPNPTAQAAANGKKQLAIYNALPRSVVVPVWNGIEMLVDPFSASKKREINIRMFMMMNTAYVASPANTIRGWRKVEYVHTNKS